MNQIRNVRVLIFYSVFVNRWAHTQLCAESFCFAQFLRHKSTLPSTSTLSYTVRTYQDQGTYRIRAGRPDLPYQSPPHTTI